MQSRTTDNRRRPIRRRWFAVSGLGVAGLAAALFLAPADGLFGNPAAGSARDGGSTGAGHSSAPSAATPSAGLPSPATVRKAAGPAAAAPTRVSIKAADFDVRVLPLTVSEDQFASGLLVPPLTLEAYWLTNYGVPGRGSVNTTYIAGHSLDGGDAPFNRLSDTGLVGKPVTVTTAKGVLGYVVDSVTTYDKNTLKDSDIWSVAPNRVVLISCYTQDPWGKNVVLTASPRR
ncbi:class F sortase [Pseudarthrobacter sp. NPDC092424]|uniref:class F sortase n=1 Tax=Pseudarthrobacter sp. NPDC092424 TaxID=3364415 RepID=UPI00382201FC